MNGILNIYLRNILTSIQLYIKPKLVPRLYKILYKGTTFHFSKLPIGYAIDSISISIKITNFKLTSFFWGYMIYNSYFITSTSKLLHNTYT